MSRTPALPLTAEAALRKKCSRILSAHKRRARADGKTLHYSLDDLVDLATKQRTCGYCLYPVALDFQFDHRCPIARGGHHELYNLEVACPRCNQLKGRLTNDEFVRFREFLKGLRVAASDDLCRRLLAGTKVYRGSRMRITLEVGTEKE